MWCLAAAVLALGLLAGSAGSAGAGSSAGSGLQQDCFCSEIWACVSRKGFPYSECDQEGRKVICCVRRDAVPLPLPPPLPRPQPQPLPRPQFPTPSPEQVTTTEAQHHFRFSTGSHRPDGDSSRRGGGFVPTTDTATPLFETTRLPPTTPAPGRIVGFSSPAPSRIPGFATPAPGRITVFTTSPPVRIAGFTTPSSVVGDTTRFSPLDGFDVVGDRFSSTSVSSGELSRFSTTPSASPESFRSSTERASTRYQENAVTARPPAPQGLHRRPHHHKYEEDYDDGVQEIGWDDGEPHVTWSGEDFQPLRQPRVRQHPQQQRQHHQQTQEQQQHHQHQQQQQHQKAQEQHQQHHHQQQREPKKLEWEQIASSWSSWRDCGFKGTDSGLDGTAEPSEWPWHAALLEAASDRYVCGAALVGPTWLLTAAHCVMDYSQEPSSLKVRVGELDVRSDTESFTQERGVVDVVPHPAFDLPTLRHDVALVRIARAPRDHRNVASVCLPANRLDADLDLADEEFPREGTTCVVTGWGRKDEESPHSEVLKEIRVPVWSRGTCQDALRRHLGDSFQLPSTAVCAGAKGRDACDGDGGGPLVCQVQPGGRWMQVGIVSYGIGCGRNGSPGVYTRVSRYASWIRSVAGNLRSFEGAPFPSPSPLPAPARESPPQAAPAVSRVRVNHYRASTTSRPPSRSVVVLRDSEEDVGQDEGSAAIGEGDRLREFPGTTPPSSEEETGTTDQPRATTPAPRRTSIAANLIAGSDRVGRVVHHHSNYRNALEAVPEQRNTTTGPSKATFPFNAGTSFIRTSFGTSEWSYPLEAQNTASKNKTKIPVRVGMPGKWYSPSYTGSYRGDAAGSRVPGQILSNVAGKTGAGINRWYSPYYTGSYRGGYNVNVKEVASAAGKQLAPDQAEQASPRPRVFNNVRPPLAQNRWYDGDSSRWYTTYHNGSYRTGYMSKPHRFGNAEGMSKLPVVGAAVTGKQEDAKGKDDAADLSWTYLVQTGTQGAVITLDRAKNATNGTMGDQGSASSWAYPVVSLDEARAGRTLVNISNTFTYPSAPKPGTRNSSSSSNTNQHHSNNLSSSYSIYRIYPSVYNPEYSAKRRVGKANSVSVGDTKPTETSSTTKSSARGPAGEGDVRDMAGSVVGYSHFSSGDTAVSFNITRDMTNRTGEDISTARTTTADSTTGGEGMDVPPVQEHGAVTTEGSSDMTSTPGDYSTTSDSNPSTTASVLDSVATSGLDSTSTTDPNSVESTTLVGREPERVAHVRHQDRGEEAELQGDSGLRVSALARRGGRTDSRGLNATEEEPVFAPRRRRPETDPDTAWGDRTGSVRTTVSPRSRAMTTSEAASLPIEEAPPMRQRSRQWSRAQQWPAGENAVTPRKPVSFHPGVRESKVVRSGVSNPEPEVEEPVVVISPEGFEQPSGRGGNRARGRRPTATPETEATSPRTRNRNRQSEFRRRGTSGAGTLPSPALPAQHALPPAPTSEAPVPVADALPQHNPEPSYTTSAPRSRNFGSKKASRKLKKIVFTSAEEQQAVQETVYQSGHKQQQQQQQHEWAPAAPAAIQPSIISAEGAAADVDVIGERPQHTAVEDLEREDVYSFISQRAKRRRLNANKVASEAQEVPAPQAPLVAQVAQVPQVPPGSRWGRSRRPHSPPQ